MRAKEEEEEEEEEENQNQKDTRHEIQCEITSLGTFRQSDGN